MTREKAFIIIIISALSIISSLFFLPSPIQAACRSRPDIYGNCGTCSCPAGKVGTCSCDEDLNTGYCYENTSNCRTPTNTPTPAGCYWNGSGCSGTCGSGQTCTKITTYVCVCVSNNPTNTPIPTNTPTPKPTDTPVPNCSCSNDGRCVGNVNSCSFAVAYKCDYQSNLGLCPGTDNAWVYDKCEATGEVCTVPDYSPGYYCAYVAGCANPTIAPTTAACQENNQGCGATPVPLDCNYNATGCNLCGVGRVKAIYCGTVS